MIIKENTERNEKNENLLRYLKRFTTFGLLVVLLYTSYSAIMAFYLGYHNLDLSYNFINLGFNNDLTTQGDFIELHTLYLQGRNQIKYGFNWICFDVIIAFILGYLFKKE